MHLSSRFRPKPNLARRLGLLTSSASALAWLTGCDPRAAGPEIAPDVGYTLLDGTRSRTSSLRGSVVLLNFWATSCAPCVHEMPLLARTHQKYLRRGFQTLAVAMQYDPPAAVAHFAETRALPFGVVIDNTGALAQSFGDIKATPTSLLLDRRGRIAQRWVGAPEAADLHARIERLLAAA
jgi:peroxiredoxin